MTHLQAPKRLSGRLLATSLAVAAGLTILVPAAADASTTATALAPSTVTVAGTVQTATTTLPKFTSVRTPMISGTKKVGSTLSATVASWKPSATFTYQWKRNGVAIAGATKATYRLTCDDRGSRISVKIVGTHRGYAAATRTSKPTDTITTGVICAQRPTIEGTAQAGKTLTARVGTIYPGNVRASYQWLRNGVVISGATHQSYAVVNRDAGKKLSVKVSYHRDDLKTIVKTTVQTKTVAPRAKVAVEDGRYAVGTQIKAGTYYRTGSDYCYWERGEDGKTNPHGWVNAPYRVYMTVLPTDDYFYTEGCNGWTLSDGTGAGSGRTSITQDGMYLVGADIAPGVYKTTTSTTECYMQLDQDASMRAGKSLGYNMGKRAVWEISLSKGQVFTTWDCGTLTRES
ncbi:hypothetical protein [Demequina soli]|uniref:hypothetical protein n=1 Tax=Demequina soli TaxID=1638987 RepID=UPI00078235B0|nr:hypothetical protein [Demequina soli]